MKTKYPEISTLIPHRPPMLLVDEVVRIEEKKGVVRAVIKDGHLFLRDDGTLLPEVYCELIAQGFGACEAVRRLQQGQSIDGGGYLASIRDFQLFHPARVGEELLICSEKIDACFGTHIVRGEVFCNGKRLAQATVYIYMWQRKEDNV